METSWNLVKTVTSSEWRLYAQFFMSFFYTKGNWFSHGFFHNLVMNRSWKSHVYLLSLGCTNLGQSSHPLNPFPSPPSDYNTLGVGDFSWLFQYKAWLIYVGAPSLPDHIIIWKCVRTLQKSQLLGGVTRGRNSWGCFLELISKKTLWPKVSSTLFINLFSVSPLQQELRCMGTCYTLKSSK